MCTLKANGLAGPGRLLARQFRSTVVSGRFGLAVNFLSNWNQIPAILSGFLWVVVSDILLPEKKKRDRFG